MSTDAQGYKAVNYAQLTPVLLEAIRELAAQNEVLQAQLRLQQQRTDTSTTAFEQRLRTLEAAADRAAVLTLQAQLARLLGEAPPSAPAPAAR
ncbi:hypothetical protein H8B15_03200 [Hymenobacter sp. BT507]|uniref:Uncharacterized protein n=1 Tax=Hymenobacter citatus TaxID=2763506 RepID=A0ABR7MH71_9BACT|nr:hypothetical protein [Hymenobacter citatus]MBC6609913.1 hypothetical protein [Hymenobacter citatus]